MNKYYVPRPKIKITCNKCDKMFLGMASQKFCSSICKLQFNERKFRERSFVKKHRDEIGEILGDSCAKCPREADQVHHKTYYIPIRKINYIKSSKHNKVTPEDVHNMLKEYCKYLMPLCSGCHQKIHK